MSYSKKKKELSSKYSLHPTHDEQGNMNPSLRNKLAKSKALQGKKDSGRQQKGDLANFLRASLRPTKEKSEHMSNGQLRKYYERDKEMGIKRKGDTTGSF